MKLLQTRLKVPYFEKYCPLNKKVPAEGLSHKIYNMVHTLVVSNDKKI